MSQLHLRQLKSALTRRFTPSLDLSDLPGTNADSPSVLTRALSALAVAEHSPATDAQAAAAVVDGTNDNGLDAIHFDRQNKTLLLVQAKWSQKGTGGVASGDVHKFINGFRDLLSARWDRFNEKIQAKQTQIESALDDPHSRIHLIVIGSGSEGLGSHAKTALNDLLEEQNQPSTLVHSSALALAECHGLLVGSQKSASVDLDVALREWGHVSAPHTAYYGMVTGLDVARWLKEHPFDLFHQNLREFLSDSDVNEELDETIANAPENFWYFNNGITAVCEELRKKPIGGATNRTGTFACTGLSIVNGAQTVGSLHKVLKDHSDTEAEELLKNVEVSIRLISLENAGETFGEEVTRATNTQNKVERRDFVALDSQQSRLAEELHLDGVSYVYRSGETVVDPKSGFDIVEATIAQACASSKESLIVHAKGAIGRLWKDTNEEPYTRLFHPKVTGPEVWRRVQIMREVEGTLEKEKESAKGEKLLFIKHANRLCVHLVLKSLEERRAMDLTKAFDGNTKQSVRRKTREVAEALQSTIQRELPGKYLGNVVKSQSDTRTVLTSYRNASKKSLSIPSGSSSGIVPHIS